MQPVGTYRSKLRLHSTRHRLLRDVFLVVLLLVGTLLALYLVQVGRARKEISQNLLSRAAQQAQAEFLDHFKAVEKGLSIVRKWGKAGQFGYSSPSSLRARLLPMLENLPQAKAIMLAASDGSEFFLMRDGDGWLARISDPELAAGQVKWQRWWNGDELEEEWQQTIEYDPRRRPWFKGAIALDDPEEAFWTEPYLFFTSNSPGITGSVRWQEPAAGGRTLVFAIDLLLEDIFAFASRLPVSENGQAFLLTEAGAVYTQPTGVPGLGGDFFSEPDPLQSPIVAEAIRQWKNEGRPVGRPLTLGTGGDVWWAGFSPLNPERPVYWIGIAIPESDIIGQVPRKRSNYIYAALLLAAIGLLLAFLVVRRYRHQVKEMPKGVLKALASETEIRELIAKGETGSLEFKSTVRMNLKSGKSGKEIELAWLKTVVAFLNTDGGILFIGVGDDGAIRGLDADRFESDDRCLLHLKNLLHQHIGAEFVRSIHYALREVEGKEIAVLECERARKPVFLKAGREEEYYVRSGPSSVKLTGRQLLQYLEQRK